MKITIARTLTIALTLTLGLTAALILAACGGNSNGDSVSREEWDRLLDEFDKLQTSSDDTGGESESVSEEINGLTGGENTSGSSDPATATPGAADTLNTEPAWKRLYFDEIWNMFTYTAEHDWSSPDCWDCDHSGPYFVELFWLSLADLNFDGTPELLAFGDGYGGLPMMAFSITDTGTVGTVLSGLYGSNGLGMWNFPWPAEGIELCKRTDDGSLVYRINTIYSDYLDVWYGVHIFDSMTSFDNNTHSSTMIASYSYEYQGQDLLPVFYFNDVEVDESEYHLLVDGISSGYEEVDYTLSSLEAYTYIHSEYDYDTSQLARKWIDITDADIISFLDSYVPEL